MLTKRKNLILFIVLCFFINTINVVAKSNERDDDKEWTVICYLAGDNFLDWFMKENMKELIKIGSSNRVNVIAFLDTTDNETKMFEVNKDDVIRIPTRIVNYSWLKSELNTGDPQTLINFATWAVRKYPAKKYFLILGGYGEGWTGLMHDMNDGQKNVDVLSLEEFEYALENITQSINAVNGKERIDILGLDACYMGMLEIMYQVKDYANYLISSQNEEALDGWPYDKLLEIIIANPEMDGSQLASKIVDSYIDSIKGNPSKMSNVLTLSVVDLKFVEELVREIDNLSLLLLQAQKENPRKMAFVERVTNRFLISAHIAGRYVPYSVLYDLSDFVENVKVGMTKNKKLSDSTQHLSELLSKVITKERHQELKGKYNLGIGGISLYFAGMDTEGYKENNFSIDTHWDEFITERASIGQKLNRKN
ncbi:MAG: Clostripain precursor [Candidatus Scalindua rubra]|uniref:Clostripain n=1 Tax=Candidatus Scalindua rubra TaxID=1872076 RepID=A0A1E3XCV4_9BACT|nr:MAG: Clostripain precursor [Candidatus Scalindua rubra]